MVTLEKNSWFGLVLGQAGMETHGDMLIFFADAKNSSSVGDYHSMGYRPPE